MWAALTIFYVAICVMSLLLTAREHLCGQKKTSLYRVIGYLACLVWPLTFMSIFVEAQRRAA